MSKLSIGSLICLCLLGFNVFGQSRSESSSRNAFSLIKTESLDQKIVRISKAYNLDPRLFHSLIYAESTFKQNAMSGKGAGCLTQLMPATARRFGLRVDGMIDERFSNIDKCLNAGANYLAFLLTTFHGDVRLALAGYNAGEGAVMKFGYRIPPYEETVKYVEKICALYYGQSGHGVAMAYNQPLAQLWTNALYRTWRPLVRNTNQIFAVNSAPAINGANQTNLNQPNQAGLEKTAKKPGITRVQVEETPRLRTQSLTFGN